MHTLETQEKSVERRAQGWSYARIAAELGVAKSTLIKWSPKFRFDSRKDRQIFDFGHRRSSLVMSGHLP